MNTRDTYRTLKQQYPGAVLLLQIGDSYWTYGDDADLLSAVFPANFTHLDDGTPVAIVEQSEATAAIGHLLLAGQRIAVADHYHEKAKAEVERFVQHVTSDRHLVE